MPLYLSTRINSDRALLGGGSMSGTRTVPYGREDRRLLHISFSQDVLPKPIYQTILSEDYNNQIIPFFNALGIKTKYLLQYV